MPSIIYDNYDNFMSRLKHSKVSLSILKYGRCETSRRFVDSSTTHTAVDGGIKAGIYCTLEEKKLLHAIMLALEF